MATLDWWSALAPGLSPETRLREDEPLAPKTTMRVGGAARYYAEPASIADLGRLWQAARAAGVEIFLLGRGSNLIVSDEGFGGLVVRLQGPAWQRLEVSDGVVEAAAGVRLKALCAAASKAGLGGFEFLEGIPGTLGGSLRMNAGAMGGWIFDLVEEVTFLTSEGQVESHPAAFFHSGYRSCPELAGAVALEARLRARGAVEAPAIRAQLDSYAAVRKASQPREPSAGCIFKNPENGYAGKIVDELGLKGATEGRARVSEVHGNFIVNAGGATTGDIIALIRRIRARARTELGVELEPEALLVGAKWEDVL